MRTRRISSRSDWSSNRLKTTHVESLSNDSPSPPSERLVLVSDSSTEAERLIASLRVRKVKVRDVPLMLLASRVEAQKPMLVICDGQAPRVAAAIEKMRQGVWGKHVDILLLGLDAKVIETVGPHLGDPDKRCFSRPIDVYSVLQRVEEILGEPEEGTAGPRRSMASLPRVEPNSIAAPRRPVTPPPRRGRSSIPQSQNIPSAEPASSPGSAASHSQPQSPSIAPASEPGGPDSVLGVPSVSRMSDELEQLLLDAERRLGPAAMSIQPVSLPTSRLSPEEELDAILPADVLAALDEPVDLDDDDETSHPAIRSERPSSMVPRGNAAAVFPRIPTHADPGVERGTGTASNEEDTPVGRMGGRRFTTSGGSDIPSSPKSGAGMTPLPPPIAQVPSYPAQVTQAAAASVKVREFIEEPSRGSEHAVEGTQAELMVRFGERGHPDSYAPEGTPLAAESEHSADSHEAGSTAPPHAASRRNYGWSMLDAESPLSRDGVGFRREREAVATLANPSTAAASAHHGLGSALVPAPATTEYVAPEPMLGRAPPDSRQRYDYSADESSLVGRAPLAPRLPVEPQQTASAQGKPEIETRPGFAATAEGRPLVEIPASIGRGDAVRALAKCVRGRYSGALAIEDDSGIRRIVFREGDFVMVASGIEGESLVAFLIQRGDLDPDAARLTRKLPQFGRHAGAALIAHGYLRQDELWPVLRAHAEWLLGRTIGVQQGAAGLEVELSARLQAEPAVFGGTTGAEVLVEIVRRMMRPEHALEALGGPQVRVTRGPQMRLLSECALLTHEVKLVERANATAIGELLTQAESRDFASAIYALVELSILSTLSPAADESRAPESVLPRDGLDDEAVRHKVALRRALVDEADYYTLLGIARDATGYEVRHAYLSLRREFDPGRLLSATTAELREDVDLIIEVLDEAYDVLRESARRERYRRALEANPK